MTPESRQFLYDMLCDPFIGVPKEYVDKKCEEYKGVYEGGMKMLEVIIAEFVVQYGQNEPIKTLKKFRTERKLKGWQKPCIEIYFNHPLIQYEEYERQCLFYNHNGTEGTYEIENCYEDVADEKVVWICRLKGVPELVDLKDVKLLKHPEQSCKTK